MRLFETQLVLMEGHIKTPSTHWYNHSHQKHFLQRYKMD